MPSSRLERYRGGTPFHSAHLTVAAFARVITLILSDHQHTDE